MLALLWRVWEDGGGSQPTESSALGVHWPTEAVQRDLARVRQATVWLPAPRPKVADESVTPSVTTSVESVTGGVTPVPTTYAMARPVRVAEQAMPMDVLGTLAFPAPTFVVMGQVVVTDDPALMAMLLALAD